MTCNADLVLGNRGGGGVGAVQIVMSNPCIEDARRLYSCMHVCFAVNCLNHICAYYWTFRNFRAVP